MGSYPYPRNGIVKLDFEYILLFKKQGNPPLPSRDRKINSAMTNEEWNTFFNGHWVFSGVKQDKHLAMFPEELPHRLIKMFSFEGDIVLDPFLGSGTTSLAAKKLGRNSIGYEINADFIPVIKSKVGDSNLIDDATIQIVKQDNVSSETVFSAMRNLPYQFVDVHKMDKKIDVKKCNSVQKLMGTVTPNVLNCFLLKKLSVPN